MGLKTGDVRFYHKIAYNCWPTKDLCEHISQTLLSCTMSLGQQKKQQVNNSIR